MNEIPPKSELKKIDEEMRRHIEEHLPKLLWQKQSMQALGEICWILAEWHWKKMNNLGADDSEQEPKREDRSTFLEGLAEIE